MMLMYYNFSLRRFSHFSHSCEKIVDVLCIIDVISSHSDLITAENEDGIGKKSLLKWHKRYTKVE